ncbi:hypothetical protein [Micromonospora sp. HNM0581]|uniref:hypothetical protein n=1 Tax=Micromonospora sp. HNM0581 TaxID=2716341 RepID=UPI00197BEC21|nr:hypothetical protein [Micromonospora sp. HNM0581]
MQSAFRFLLITSLQVAAVVIAFAFLMTLLFEPGEWKRWDWLIDLTPLLATILFINLLVQSFRLRRRARRR